MTLCIVQSLCFLNLKFQASGQLLRLYRLGCVIPGWYPPKTGFLATRLKMILLPPALCVFFTYLSLVVRKPVFGNFDQVQHKPGCTATEDGKRLEISYLRRRGIVLCSENKGADQLRGYRVADLRLCFRTCIMLVFS